MTKTYAITGTITVDDTGTLAGTITGQEDMPVEPPIDPPPIDPPAGPPGPVTDLAAEASGANSIVLSWTAIAGATDYNIQGSPDGRIWTDIGNTSRTTYMIGGLPAGAPYWARVFSENIDGEWGEVSNVATATTDKGEVPEPPIEPVPGDPIIHDDFSQYTIGQSLEGEVPDISAPGVKWQWNAGTPVTVGSGGRDGGNCLHFNFKDSRNPNDNTGDSSHSYCEQQLRLCSSKATAHQEVWVEFWLMTDDVPRTRSSNDKFLAIHNVNHCDGGRSAYGRQTGLFNTWGDNVKYCTISFSNWDQSGNVYDTWTHPYAGGGAPPYGPGHDGAYDEWWKNWNHAAQFNAEGSQQNAITAAQSGTWVRYRTNYKCNDNGVANGHMRHWRNDFLLAEGVQIERDFRDGYNKSDGLYLMGYQNAGFTRDSTWKMDQITVWASDPGWTF